MCTRIYAYVGDRYGWAPTLEDLSDFDANLFDNNQHRKIASDGVHNHNSITEMEFELGFF